MNGEQLQRVEKHKQLGVTFTQDMTFGVHIENNCKKAMNRVTALKRIGYKIPRKSRLSIYIAFIRPILEFGFELYDNSSKQILDRLENVQRQALLFTTAAYKKTSHRQLLCEVGLPLLEKRRLSQKKKYIIKATHNLVPEYIIN